MIGNGAREHSICWALRKSKECEKIFCIPGNAGIEEIAICSSLNLNNKRNIFNFCKKNSIDLVVIGPEQYLEEGLSDYLTKKGFVVFGPTKKAAMLETSKSFAKKFLAKNKIATADYKEFKTFDTAKKYILDASFPLVVKADGLAAGKGVMICQNKVEALKSIEEIMKKKKFGDAGKKVIIENFLQGFEISYFAFIDKKTFLPLGYALDHKRAFDNDLGPNTGGMGCFTPSKRVNQNLERKILNQIVKKTFIGLKKEKFVYRGILFIGLMITNKGPYVIEFNVRFGDPECQTLLRNLKSDILKIFLSTARDELSKVKIQKENKSVVCVVLASKGYPSAYEKNKEIKNIQEAKQIYGVEIFHAGTKKKRSKIVSSGGRVLSITSKAAVMKVARINAYKALKKINWSFGFFRKDIAGLKKKR